MPKRADIIELTAHALCNHRFNDEAAFKSGGGGGNGEKAWEQFKDLYRASARAVIEALEDADVLKNQAEGGSSQ